MFINVYLIIYLNELQFFLLKRSNQIIQRKCERRRKINIYVEYIIKKIFISSMKLKYIRVYFRLKSAKCNQYNMTSIFSIFKTND